MTEPRNRLGLAARLTVPNTTQCLLLPTQQNSGFERDKMKRERGFLPFLFARSRDTRNRREEEISVT